MILLDEIGLFSSFVDESQANNALSIILPTLVNAANDCNALIAEKFFSLWEINGFVWLIVSGSKLSYPVLVPAVFAAAVMNVMNANDEDVFGIVARNIKSIVNVKAKHELRCADEWNALRSMAY